MNNLYHGTIYSFEIPDIDICTEKKSLKKTKDFGNGFYATSSIHQAKNWAIKKRNEKKEKTGYVNIYILEESYKDKLSVKEFTKTKEDLNEWIDFVHAFRNNLPINVTYDIIHGPVADDDIYRSFALYETRQITKKELLDRLLCKKSLKDQFCFRTKESLSYLKFVRKIEYKNQNNSKKNNSNENKP